MTNFHRTPGESRAAVGLMRSQPPIRLLQSFILAFGTLALLAFYVALSAPGAASQAAPGPTPFPTPVVRLTRAATTTPAELVLLAPASPAAGGPRLPFTVTDDGVAQAVTAGGETVGEALAQAGYIVYLADRVTPPLEARLTPGLTVVIDRSQPVTIEADGGSVRTRVSPEAGTVAEALAEAGVASARLRASC